MRYLLLLYENEKEMHKRLDENMTVIMAEYEALTQEIKEKGIFEGGNALKPTATATTVRRQEGKALTTDGPFAETKEQLGGYYLVDCRDLDEAIEIAGRIPVVKYGGSVEIRPIWELG
jgi:hypothetical protein